MPAIVCAPCHDCLPDPGEAKSAGLLGPCVLPETGAGVQHAPQTAGCRHGHPRQAAEGLDHQGKLCTYVGVRSSLTLCK